MILSLQTLYCATSNNGKLLELQDLFASCSRLHLCASPYAAAMPNENANTFVANAYRKAQYTASIMNAPVLADDSGLCVASLRGAPGLYSARYADKAQEPTSHYQHLLNNMQHLPPETRQAWFVCALVIVFPQFPQCPLIGQGVWHGTISQTAQGNNGFGYDPVFIPTQHNPQALTVAQLPSNHKQIYSHRALAFVSLWQQLACFVSQTPCDTNEKTS